MGILPEPEITQAEKTAKEVREINAWADGTISVISDRVREMMSRFWSNSNANPMQLAEAYGTSAILLFQKLGALQEVMKQIDPNYQEVLPPYDKYDVVLNEDGTVTITEKEIQNGSDGSESGDI